ncbi:Cupredoxin [Fennellomyces sp. T-0311]|nr:Cupredoxin [Fennellomyces sp. T-0311]
MLSYYLALLFIANVVLARVRELEINLSVGTVDPDCFGQGYDRLLVDGQYPAPPIRVTKGDQVRITVRNSPDSNRLTTIHYHGIFQIGTTEADGFPGVTQEAIPPGGIYQQNFQIIDQAGTFFYHAHSDLQEDSIYGAFIVYESDDAWPSDQDDHKLREGPYEYDEERVLTLSEWWHQDEMERLDYIMGPNFAGMKDADSYLLNGRTVYDPNQPTSQNCEGYSVIDVEPGKVYRLRVIGATTFGALGISIARHTMTIIEVDGVLIQPYQTTTLQVAPGQRFSVLLSADQAAESYYINSQAYFTMTPRTNGVGILRYNLPHHEKRGLATKPDIFEPHAYEASVTDMPVLPPPDPSINQEWFFQFMKPITPDYGDFHQPPDRTVIITPVERRLPDGTVRWLINDRMPTEYDPPLIQQIARMDQRQVNSTAIDLHIDGYSDGFDEGRKTFPLETGEIVDFVIHTTMLEEPNICVGHPWHTHGMVHYPIASGPGEYIHARDWNIRTYPTPIAKDTTMVYPYPPPETAPGGTPCGWTKIRLYVSNPGLWGFHCHITGHMMQGMMTVLEVSPEQIPIFQN